MVGNETLSMAATDHNTRNGALVKLSEIFAYEGEAPLEIEILPKALSGSSNEVLRDGQCIGVPNSILVQAFLAARSSLFDRSAKYVSNGRHQSLPDDVGQW